MDLPRWCRLSNRFYEDPVISAIAVEHGAVAIAAWAVLTAQCKDASHHKTNPHGWITTSIASFAHDCFDGRPTKKQATLWSAFAEGGLVEIEGELPTSTFAKFKVRQTNFERWQTPVGSHADNQANYRARKELCRDFDATRDVPVTTVLEKVTPRDKETRTSKLNSIKFGILPKEAGAHTRARSDPEPSVPPNGGSPPGDKPQTLEKRINQIVTEAYERHVAESGTPPLWSFVGARQIVGSMLRENAATEDELREALAMSTAVTRNTLAISISQIRGRDPFKAPSPEVLKDRQRKAERARVEAEAMEFWRRQRDS